MQSARLLGMSSTDADGPISQRRNMTGRIIAAAATLTLAIVVPSIYVKVFWNGSDPTVLWIPGYVLVWGFLGGCAAVLFSLLYDWARPAARQDSEHPLTLMVMCRPVLGAVVGAAAYLLVKAGVVVLTSPPASSNSGDITKATLVTINPEFFAGISFLTGFADLYTRSIFSSVVRGWSRKVGAEGERSESAPPFKGDVHEPH